MFFYRYKDLLFEVTTGPAPSFVFTLSLSFDFNVSTKDYAMPSEPRWQMTPMEYATFLNSSKGDDSGKCFVQFTPPPPFPLRRTRLFCIIIVVVVIVIVNQTI